MAKINKKTLAAQAEKNRQQAETAQRFATATDANREATRAAMLSGLGSEAQMRGEYVGSAAPRDMSRYSQGLIIGGLDYQSDVEMWRALQRRGADPASYYRHSGGQGGLTEGQAYGNIATAGLQTRQRGNREIVSPERQAQILAAGPAKNELFKAKKNKKTGEWSWVDKDGDGQPDVKGGFQTIGALADKGNAGAMDRERSWELTGQIVEVEDAFAAMRAAAEAGDFATADAKHAEAMALVEQYGLNERFDPTGLNRKKGAGNITFGVGDKWDPLADTEGAANQALGSPTGMLVGSMVNRAQKLQDPNSQASTEFKNMLSQGALTAVEAARTNALRSMAGEERGAARSMRDMALQTGAGSASAKQFAVAARMGERFATQRAGLETSVGAAKAEIYSNTAKAYEQFRTDFAKDATVLASAWVNDQSGVRDSFRAMQMNMAMNWSSNLMGFASNAQNNATRLVLAELGETDTGGWGGAAGGAISGAAAGTTVSPGWGTLIGAVGGGVAGYFS